MTALAAELERLAGFDAWKIESLRDFILFWLENVFALQRVHLMRPSGRGMAAQDELPTVVCLVAVPLTVPQEPPKPGEAQRVCMRQAQWTFCWATDNGSDWGY